MARFCAAPLVLLLCALAAPGVRAQTSDSLLTLDGLVADALARSSSLRATRIGAEALQQRVQQAGVFADPTVTVTGYPTPIMMGPGEQVAELEVMQMLPAPGVRSRARQAAVLSAEAEGLLATAQAADARIAATEAYLSLRRLARSEALLDTFLLRLDRFAEAAMARYAAGQAAQSDVLMLQVERDRLRAERLLLDAERAEAVGVLSRLLERPLPPSFRLAPLPQPDTSRLFYAPPLRLERAAFDRQITRAEVETELAHRAFFPEVGVGLMYGLVVATGEAKRAPDMVGLMASVRLPLQRGRLRAQVEEARLREAEAGARRDAFDAALASEIGRLRATARQEAAALSFYRDRLLPETDLTLSSVRAAYGAGQVPYLTLLDAERTHYAVQQAETAAETRYRLALARLARTLGFFDSTGTQP